MKLTNKIQKAIIASATLHKNQVRKDKPLPFIIHPYSVAVILSNYTNDEDIIVAGLLHDVLEDVPDYSADDMKREFGERVYEIVKGVSEDKDPNEENPDSVGSWEKRKNSYLDNLKKDTFEVMMVSCADKIHNLLSLQEAYKEQGEDLWKKFNAPEDKKIWFYGEVLNILKEKLKNPIVKELEKVYKEMQKIIEPKKLNYLEEKELEDEVWIDALIRATRRVLAEKKEAEKKEMPKTDLPCIYLGAVEKKGKDFDVRVYLINISNEDKIVYLMQGSFQGDEDGLVDLGHSKYKEIKIQAKGFTEIDHMRDMGEMDFTTFYNLKVEDTEYLEEINGWSLSKDRLVDIPVLNQKGYLGGFGKCGK